MDPKIHQSFKIALLVVDMQNDFVKEGGLLEVKGVRRNMKEYEGFINACREAGLLVIYTRHHYTSENNPVEAKLFPELGKGGLRFGSEGWEIYDEIKPQEGDLIIDKTRYDAFFKTDLKDILDKHNIKTVIITGTMTDVCCESTARTAMYHDYDVIFCSNLTYCSDPESHKNTLKLMASHFGRVIDFKEILSLLKGK